VAEITVAHLSEYTGRELGVPDWLTVDQAMIDHFAECSGDRQWIDVDVERAKMRESLSWTDRIAKTKHGMIPMCIGTGMGFAAIFERV
jgi:acyl dehydratase